MNEEINKLTKKIKNLEIDNIGIMAEKSELICRLQEARDESSSLRKEIDGIKKYFYKIYPSHGVNYSDALTIGKSSEWFQLHTERSNSSNESEEKIVDEVCKKCKRFDDLFLLKQKIGSLERKIDSLCDKTL